MQRAEVIHHDIKNRLEKIFGIKRVSFDTPEDTKDIEQDVLFVTIDDAQSRPSEGVVKSRVSGTLRIYSQIEKIPIGFFSKRIDRADPELTKPFFFFDVEQVVPIYQSISERSARFLFLHTAQYNPPRGTITELEFPDGESES